MYITIYDDIDLKRIDYEIRSIIENELNSLYTVCSIKFLIMELIVPYI